MRGRRSYPSYAPQDAPWIDRLPSHWKAAQLRRFATVKNGADYKDVEVAEGGYPVYGSGGEFRRADAYLHDGESVLFGRKGTIDRPLYVSGRFWTVDTMFYTTLSQSVVARYIYWYATTMPFSYYSTSTALPSMTQGDLGGHVIPVPPLDEQRQIADFLDRETARIDVLIEKQRQLIESLQQRRVCTISDAVLGRAHGRSVKPSGVPWIGDIPADWTTRPLWSMFSREKNVGFPDEPMISVYRDHGVIYKDSRANLNKTAENREIYQLIEPGWLVCNRMKAWQGSVGISTLRGIVSGHYICFRPVHHEYPGYLNWLFRSDVYTAGYRSISRGVRPGQAEIDNDDYRVMPVVVPPLDEQIRIANRLQEQTAKIDVLIEKARQFIELSRERRSALITAAVTGQIDVREMSTEGAA